MTRTYTVGPRVLVATLCLSVCLSTSLLAQRADRAIISGVVTDAQGAAVPGATVTIRNEATGVNTVQVTNAAGAYTSPPLVLGRYSVTVDLTGFKKAVSSSILLEGGDQFRQDMILQVGALNETVEVTVRGGTQRHAAGREPHGEREILSRPPDYHGRGCPPCRVRAADAARLPSDEAERRPDVPRQPVPVPHQRRPARRDREFLRWRRVRLRQRAPAKPGEHTSGGFRAGGEGHHDQLFGAVRPHQRRIHRVHGQDGHQCVSRQRLRVFCG